jgi:uncharacterized Zn finger protein
VDFDGLKMAAKRAKQKRPDRALEYVDSPMMQQRLRYRRELSARIQGNYGVYRTRVRIGSVETSSCTCPSEVWPCKHVRAMLATWKSNPDSFYNLEALLTGLADTQKENLIKMIAAMVVAAPECLAALGVDEFAEPEYDFDG